MSNSKANRSSELDRFVDFLERDKGLHLEVVTQALGLVAEFRKTEEARKKDKDPLREKIAEDFYEYKRFILRRVVAFAKNIDRDEEQRWARIMAAAWPCLRDNEKSEAYFVADQLLGKL